MLLGSVLGAILAVISPLMVISELFSLMMVVYFPAVGLMLLYRWAGFAPAMLSAMLQMMITARMLGSTFMWVAFLAGILPLSILLRFEKKHFYTQIKAAIAAFGAGIVLAVMVLYFNYGGSMIERVLLELPQTIRKIPAEMLTTVIDSVGKSLGRELVVEEFYPVFDQMIARLIPVYQVNMPGLLFSGALTTAVLCAGLGSLMLHKQGGAPEEAYLPLRRWMLPASVTGGLLLITGVSLGIYLGGLPRGQTLFFAVYNIAGAAFCIQALSSMARHMYASSLKKGTRIAILAGISALCMLGASMYVAIYGCGSAVFGRYGVMRQKYEKMNSDKNNHSDDEYRR